MRVKNFSQEQLMTLGIDTLRSWLYTLFPIERQDNMMFIAQLSKEELCKTIKELNAKILWQ